MYTIAININEKDLENLLISCKSRSVEDNIMAAISMAALRHLLEENNGVLDIPAEVFATLDEKEEKIARTFLTGLGGVAVIYKAKSLNEVE